MAKRKAGKIISAKILELSTELQEINKQLDSLKTRKSEIENTIVDLHSKWEFTRSSGKSDFFDLPELNKSLRVTYPDSSASVDPYKFIEIFGVDTFFEICTISSATFDMDKWLLARKEERVVASKLKDALKEGSPRKPIVAFGKLKEE